VAVEHRDGTASVTTFDDGNQLFYERPYPYASEKRFRKSQLQHREHEILSIIDYLTKVNEGLEVPANNIKAANNGVDVFFNMQQLKGRLLMSHKVIGGHSFGAATSIHVTRKHPTMFQGALLLDPWLFPLSPATPQMPTPVLVILSQHFTKWKPNQCVAREYMKENVEMFKDSRILRLIDSGHQNQCDFALLFRTVIQMVPVAGGPVEPVEALRQNNWACLDFMRHLWQVQDHPKSLTEDDLANSDPLWGVVWPESTGLWTLPEAEWKASLLASEQVEPVPAEVEALKQANWND